MGLAPCEPGGPGQPAPPGPADLRPPTPEEVSRLLALAYKADPDFAVLLWLAATTGARRGELCALRWSSVDLDAAELVIVRNLIMRGGQLVEKDTKTHAARRIALSDDSIALLDGHRRRCAERAQACGAQLPAQAFVFSFDPAGRQPMNPDSVTHRFGRLAKQLGLHARLHDLRHYAATQLIARRRWPRRPGTRSADRPDRRYRSQPGAPTTPRKADAQRLWSVMAATSSPAARKQAIARSGSPAPSDSRVRCAGRRGPATGRLAT